MKCPVCVVAGYDDPGTDYFYDQHADEDWDRVAKELILEIKAAEELNELIPTVKGNVTVRDGQLWVSAWDVFPAAQRRLGETDLLRIGQQIFEVLHYNHDGREYLVRVFSMTLSDEDISRLEGP
jgi:hypothetical protein